MCSSIYCPIYNGQCGKKVNIYVYVCDGSTWPIILLDRNYYIVDNYNTQIFYNFDLVILIIYFMNVHKILSVIQEISIISLKLNDT